MTKKDYKVSEETDMYLDALNELNILSDKLSKAVAAQYGEEAEEQIIHDEFYPIYCDIRKEIEEYLLSSVEAHLECNGNSVTI